MCFKKYRDLSDESVDYPSVGLIGPEVFVEAIMEEDPFVEIGE